MGFFNDFLKNIKNKITGKKELPAPNAVEIHVFSDSQQEEDEFFNRHKTIYDEPTPSSIHSNISTKQSCELSYLFDMAYIAATADNCFYLPHPYKIHHSGKKAQEFETKFNDDTIISAEYLKKNIKASKKLDIHTSSRSALYEEIRRIYPDFCHNMDKKVSEEDLEFYKKNKIQLKKCLYVKEGYSDEISLRDQLAQYQDNLAKVIDTLDFSKACKIEDTFVLSELDKFFEMYSKLPQEEQHETSNKKIKMQNGNKIGVIVFAQKLKKEREDRIGKYSTIEELYNKLGKQSGLRLSINQKTEENTNHIQPSNLHSEDAR